MHPCARISVSLLAALCVVARPLPGQIAPTPPAPTQPPATSGEVAIELSPFTVTADKDVGYLAGNTLAGSRLNTPLKDTAASISVMTEEFIKDIGAFDLSEALEYGNNLQLDYDDGAEPGAAPAGNPTIELPQTYRVRGLRATTARNGFEWKLSSDTYNVERIEDSRGPNSILFGVGSAGGVINVTTKRANLLRTATSLQFGAGSRDAWRGVFDHNHVLLRGKLAVRLSAVWNQAKNYRLFAYSESHRLHLATKYQLTGNTQVRAEFQCNKVEENVPRFSALTDFAMTWIDAGRPTFSATAPASGWSTLGGSRLGANQPRYIANTGQLMNMTGQILSLSAGNQGMPVMDPAIQDFRINTGGPGQDRGNDSHATSIFLEHKFGRRSFLELAYNHQEYDWRSFDPQFSNRLYYDPNETLPGTLGANPYVRRLFLESYWRIFDRAELFDTGRASFATEFDGGRAGLYRLALLGEYEKRRYRGTSLWEVYTGRPFNTLPDANANKVWRRNYVTEGDWGTYYVQAPTRLLDGVTDAVTGAARSSYWVASDDQDDAAMQKAALVSLQSIQLKGRLVIGAGYRYDKVYNTDRGTERDPVTNELTASYQAANTQHYAFSGQTRTLGIVAHPTKHLSLLYNWASNIGLPDIRIRVLPDLGNAPPTEGKGEDYGIALTLLEGRVYARAVRYTTSEQNGATFSLVGDDGFRGTSNVILGGLVSANLISNEDYLRHEITLATGSTRDAASKGYEFQLAGNPTRSLRLSANFSITESTQENVGEEVVAWWAKEKPYFQSFPQNTPTTGGFTIADEIQQFEDFLALAKSVEGVGRLGNRKYKANFVVRYSLPRDLGPLKGAYLGGTYRYQSDALIGVMTAPGYENKELYGDPVGEAGLLAGCSLPLRRNRVRLQLNITNLLNETDYIVTRRLLAPSDQRVRNLVIRTPRSWRVTAEYSF